MKGQLAAKGGSLSRGNLLQRLVRGSLFLVERIPQTTNITRFDPQSLPKLFEASRIVDGAHAGTNCFATTHRLIRKPPPLSKPSTSSGVTQAKSPGIVCLIAMTATP